jgi:hypothetical protein
LKGKQCPIAAAQRSIKVKAADDGVKHQKISAFRMGEGGGGAIYVDEGRKMGGGEICLYV